MVRTVVFMAVFMGTFMHVASSEQGIPPDLRALLQSEVRYWRWHFGDAPGAEATDFDDSGWEKVEVGHKWWPNDSTCWYRTRIRIPERVNGVPVAGSSVVLRLGIDNETKAYVDGVMRKQFTWDDEILLCDNAQPGDLVTVALDCINRPGYGSLYKAELATSVSAPMLDALQELLAECDTATSDSAFVEPAEAAHWADLRAKALAQIDLDAYHRADMPAFFDSVEKARAELLSDLEEFEDGLEETERALAALKSRIENEGAAGKGMAYQIADARVVESFIQYARDDVAESEVRLKVRGLKIARYVKRLCYEALDDETDLQVPRYRTGRPTIREGAFWQNDRPVYFTGVGHFGQVRQDVPILNDYGLNIIQIEMGPSNGLPDPDTVDTSAILRNVVHVLDNAATHNVAVCLLISPHYFPQWAIDENPALADCGHGFLKHCIDAPEARAVHAKWVRNLMPRIAGHEALHSITLSNEPQYKGRCGHSRAAFHAWLADHQGSVRTMNKRYGSRYKQFEDVPMPEDDGNYPLYFDWHRFNQDRFLGFHRFLADLVHEYDPELPVHAKVMPHAFDDPGRFEVGINHEDFTLIGAIAGNDGWQNYIGDRQGDYAQEWLVNAIDYTLQHSVAPDSPIFNSEDHVIADGDQRYIPASSIRTAFWTQALFGQGAATTWVWERGQSGDLAENILTRPNCVRAMGRIGLDLNRLAPEVYALQRVPAEAAIFYSHSSLLPSQAHADEARAAFEGASFTGAVWAFVTERQAAAGGLASYKLVVVPQASHVPDAAVGAFNEYLAGGGVVVTVGECFARDEYGWAREEGLSESGNGRLVLYPDPLTARAYRDILEAQLEELEVRRPVQVTGAYGEPVWGVHVRTAEKAGLLLVSLVNFTRDPQRVVLDSEMLLEEAVNLFTEQPVEWPLTLQPLDPVLLRIRTSSL